jgi:hypothetical protein
MSPTGGATARGLVGVASPTPGVGGTPFWDWEPAAADLVEFER